MTRFVYTAQNANGETYNRSVDAPDRFELYKMIRHEGGHLLEMKEDTSSRIWTFGYWNAKVTTVSEQSKILFIRNLGTMLAAGLPLSRALGVIERQTKNPRLLATIADIGSEIRHGTTLHAAFEKFPAIFPKLLVAMVRAGEEGGKLAESLKLTSDQMERMHTLKKKIRGAMLYPSIILCAIVVIGALMMMFVVPTLAQTFEEAKAKLPLPTQIIIAISNALTGHTLLVIGGVILFVVLIIAGVRTPAGKRFKNALFLHTPMIGTMTREVNAARTARTLASLTESGVDVLTALEITRDVIQNSYFQAVLDEARNSVRGGQPLSVTFIKHEKLYPTFVGEMMAVGEETGETSDMMKHLAEFYEEEVDRKTKDLSTIIEPFLMIFIGIAVGFFAVSMITPIYQIGQTIN
jgi:type IV pilus assembly protein PilC